jgi:mutator protein MutT
MEPLEVGCAIIQKDGNLLIAQRHLNDSFGGLWEFPGGKREKDETIEACLRREVLEELGVCVRPEKLLCQRSHEIGERKIRLFFYFCAWESGDPQAIDCKDFCWVSRDTIRQCEFLPGDLEVLEDLILYWNEYFKSRENGR